MATAQDPPAPLRRASATYIAGDRLRRLPRNFIAGKLVLTGTQLSWRRHLLESHLPEHESWIVDLTWIEDCFAGGRVGPIARVMPRAIAGEHLTIATSDGQFQRFITTQAHAWVTAVSAATPP